MNKKIPLAVLVASVCVLIILFIFVFNKQRSDFRLVHITPDVGDKISTSTGVLKLTFSKPLGKDVGVEELIKGEHASIVNSIDISDSTLYIYLGTLEDLKSYKFSINDITSVTGDSITTIPIKLNTIYLPFDKLSKEQQELELSTTDKNNLDNPLLSYLPYRGESFYLDHGFVSDEESDTEVLIKAQIFLTRDDVISNRSAAIDKQQALIFEYIRSKGLDPDKLNFEYVINEPPVSVEE